MNILSGFLFAVLYHQQLVEAGGLREACAVGRDSREWTLSTKAISGLGDCMCGVAESQSTEGQLCSLEVSWPEPVTLRRFGAASPVRYVLFPKDPALSAEVTGNLCVPLFQHVPLPSSGEVRLCVCQTTWSLNLVFFSQKMAMNFETFFSILPWG